MLRTLLAQLFLDAPAAEPLVHYMHTQRKGKASGGGGELVPPSTALQRSPAFTLAITAASKQNSSRGKGKSALCVSMRARANERFGKPTHIKTNF